MRPKNCSLVIHSINFSLAVNYLSLGNTNRAMDKGQLNASSKFITKSTKFASLRATPPQFRVTIEFLKQLLRMSLQFDEH